MKNLKKILCLVLVFAMVCGMFVTANAQFKDDAEIDNLVAAEFLNEIGVIKGYEDATFKPEKILTRAEGAAIIARLILGEKADTQKAAGNPFDDVNFDDWFAGPVAFCVGEGIIAGYGNGKFGPNDTLTVVQFAKMLLEALGYESAREGFTGADWATPVGKYANELGLVENVGLTFNVGCTREAAAQMALNTLRTTMVSYSGSNVNVEGEGFKVEVGSGKAYLLPVSEIYIARTTDGNIYNTTYGGPDGYVQFAERYWDKVKMVPTATSASVFGRPVGYDWIFKGNTIASTESDAELLKVFTGTVYRGDIAAIVGQRALDALEDTTANGMALNVYVDGMTAYTGSKATDNIGTVINDAADQADEAITTTNYAYPTGNGVRTEVYMDDDTVTVVIINTYVAKATDDYDDKKKELDTIVYTSVDAAASAQTYKTLSAKDFDVEGYVEDDYLLVTIDKNNVADDTKWDYISVEAAKTVSGDLESFTNSSALTSYLRNVTVGGKKYSYSKLCTATGNGTPNSLDVTQQGTAVTLVLDAAGYVITFAEAVEANNYVYVAGIGKTNVTTSVTGKGNYVASLYFTDGTYEEVEVGAYYVGTTKTAIPNGVVNCGWHTYTVNAEGKYVLKTTAGSTGDLGLTSLAGATASIQEYGSGVTPTGKYANNKTIYLVVDEDGDCTVFNGYKNMVNVTVSALPNATETEGLVVDALLNKDATDFASVVFVGPANGSTDITAKGAKSNRGTLLYVYREAYGVSADANSVQYATQSYVLNNGVKDTITVDYATVGYLTTGLWTDIKYDATTGYIVDATKVAVDATIAADGTDEFVQYTTTAGEQIEYVDGILACATVNLPFAEEVEVIMIEKATGNATYSAASMNKVVKEANDITAGGVVFTGVLDADGEVIETLYVAIP